MTAKSIFKTTFVTRSDLHYFDRQEAVLSLAPRFSLCYCHLFRFYPLAFALGFHGPRPTTEPT
jgi:hypothetical protein